MEYIWRGNKVILRAVEISDLERYFMIDSDTDTKSQRNGDRVIFPVSSEKRKERILKLAMLDPTKDNYYLIIEDFNGNPVGNINSHSCDRINGTFEYGLGVKRKYRNNGYASDAIKILLRYFFFELNYQKAEARVFSFNKESQILHERLGFIKEGILRRHKYAMGEYHDEICYGLTKEEFYNLYK